VLVCLVCLLLILSFQKELASVQNTETVGVRHILSETYVIYLHEIIITPQQERCIFCLQHVRICCKQVPNPVDPTAIVSDSNE